MQPLPSTGGFRSCRPARSLWSALPAVLAAAFASLPAAGADGARLLRKSETADARVSYTGVKVVRGSRGKHGEGRTVRVWHRAPDQTRLEFISGGPKGGAIVQHGDRRFFVSGPGQAKWLGHAADERRLDLLLQNYSVKAVRTETIAGQKTVVVSIDPKHEGNPKKTVWVEPRTGLTLKVQVSNSRGEVTEESAFQEISFNPSFSDSLFDVPRSTPVSEPPPVQPDFTPRRPRYLPPGYQLVSTSTFHDRKHHPVHHLRYTDGLNTLSIFETKARPDADGGRASRGVRTAGVVADVRFTVVGDISQEEATRVAESIGR